MAMANINLIGVFVTKLWPVQALACGGGGDGGGATKNIISPKFSNFGDIIMFILSYRNTHMQLLICSVKGVVYSLNGCCFNSGHFSSLKGCCICLFPYFYFSISNINGQKHIQGMT